MSFASNRRKHTAAAVILFNPPDGVFGNILSYYQQVDALYVIDNSPTCDPHVAKMCNDLAAIRYIANNSNKGIAAALNQGAEMAIKDGYRYLLTMDQDTKLPQNYVADLLKEMDEFGLDNVGIIAPRYSSEKTMITERFQSRLFTMTSGNLLDLEVYRKVGPFVKDLFIDHVDHEYCMRVNAFGFRVVQVNRVSISHRPGNDVTLRLFNKRLRITSHSPTRLYYFCRNGLYVGKLYSKRFPAFNRLFLNLLLKEVIKIPFQKQPLLRIKLLLKAYSDYKKNILGPIA